MKKGIVVEIHRKHTIIMTSDGFFHKAKPIHDATVGAEVSFELLEEKKHFLLFPRKYVNSVRAVALACVLLLIAMPFYLILGEDETYAYVNVDINPSIELWVDEGIRVQSAKALNDDAKTLLKKLQNYKGKSLGKVLSMIMKKSAETGLIKNGKQVLIGVSYNERQNIPILKKVDSYLTTHASDWKIATFKVSEEVRKTAQKQDKSMNKLMAAQIAKQSEKSYNQVDDREKAIINSFYRTIKTDHSTVTDTEQPLSEQAESSKHPSKLKGKNGKIQGQNNVNEKTKKRQKVDNGHHNQKRNKHKNVWKNRKKLHEHNNKHHIPGHEKHKHKTKGNHMHHDKNQNNHGHVKKGNAN